jgi:hypothetical protein
LKVFVHEYGWVEQGGWGTKGTGRGEREGGAEVNNTTYMRLKLRVRTITFEVNQFLAEEPTLVEFK